MNIGNYKIGTRMGLGFALLLMLLVAIAVLGISRLALMQQHLQQITRIGNLEVELVTNMRDTVNERSIAARNVVLLTNSAEIKIEVARIKEQTGKYENAESKLQEIWARDSVTKAEEINMLKKINNDAAAASPVMQRVVELGLENHDQEAIKLLVYDMRPLQQKWRADLSALVTLEQHKIQGEVADADIAYRHAQLVMLLLTGIAIVAGIAIAYAITVGIVRPINAAVHVAQRVAGGDLTTMVTVGSNDETGKLMQALKDMNEELMRIVSAVRDGTHLMASASSQIAAGNLDLSSRTEQQASSLQETASSMEELTGTVKQNAENACRATELAETASKIAQAGGKMVVQVVATMGRINAAARKIADIVSVIDGIAFQTNILALNAAVEAARAGDHGRGFAVVAGEVRSLSQRSAVAAKEIKVLIDDSLNQVDIGVKLVDQTGSTMNDIVSSIGQVTDLMGSISIASREQSSGIEQINLAITQMDQVTQQNAALVEEAAASADALQKQAGKLTLTVNVFQLEPKDTTGRKAAVKPQRSVAQPGPRSAQALISPHSRHEVVPAMATARGAGKPVLALEGNWEAF